MSDGGRRAEGERADGRSAARKRRKRRDVGKTIAGLLCLLFGLIGVIPLTGGALLRSAPMIDWAEGETSRLLREQLGLSARFDVDLSLIPLRLQIRNLVVPDQRRKGPAIEASLIAVQPRFFSLLAGRIDVGDIEVEDTSVRLVFEDGQLTNVAHRFPRRNGESKPQFTRAPFRSIAITNANVDVTFDRQRLIVQGIDVDAFVERALTFDLAVRVESALASTQHVLPSPDDDTAHRNTGPPSIAHDEDRLCALDLRAEVSPSRIFVRRLSLLGVADQDPAADTPVGCLPSSNARVALRMSQFAITPRTGQLPILKGQVMARAPLSLLDRLKPGLSGEGWAGFSGSLGYDGQTRIPELSGRLTGEGMRLKGFGIASSLQAEILTTGDVIRVPDMKAGWGNGTGHFTGIEVRPFEEKMPLRIDHVSTQEIDFPGVMRDVDVTNHSWVDWNFGSTEIDRVRGTLSPFTLDGAVDGNTRDFVVWDRGFDDPSRKRMLGIDQAGVKGRFRAHRKALEFYDCTVTFGRSKLPVDLVSVGFRPQWLVVRLEPEGGTLDLADLSPIAGIEMAGRSDIFVDLKGPMKHPVLEGTLAVEDLMIGGFFAGNVQESKIHFEPLFVEFIDLRGQKGEMDYALGRARLDFDGPATVEFSSDITSARFSLVEFFDIFGFDEDPRLQGITGHGAVDGTVRYLLGGPEDVCAGGRLFVEGTTRLEDARLIGEEFSGGRGSFHLDWFDMGAGLRGVRLGVPELVLRKGSGSVFGTMRVDEDGPLSGSLIVSRVPVSRITALDVWGQGKDGFVTGFAEISGSVEAPAVSALMRTSELKSWGTTLPESTVEFRLVPGPISEPTSGAKTACGRWISSEDVTGDDASAGSLELAGRLLGNQVELVDLRLTRGADPKLSGHARLEALDATRLATFFGGEVVSRFASDGQITGTLDVEEYFLERPFASRAALSLSQFSARRGDLKVGLASDQARIVLADGSISSENLSLSATRAGALQGTLDVDLSIDEQLQLDSTLLLRPTRLSVLAATLDGVERAGGELSAKVHLLGPLDSPTIQGELRVTDGSVQVAALNAPLRKLELVVDLSRKGLEVRQGSAEWGGGEVTISGRAPLAAGVWGAAEIDIGARRVRLPIDEGVEVEFDAQLSLSLPTIGADEQKLPLLTGEVELLSARYEKPMNITADIADLTARGTKTEIESFDPEKDLLRFDVLFRSNRPIVVENELVEASLRLDPSGVRVTGTNQRFGAVGTIEVEDGGKVFLRRNEFELQSGIVRFNDPTEMAPEVDVSAVTEYRRYDSLGADGEGAATDTSAVTSGSGNWRIVMHAYGPPDNLTVDLSSDPPLAQDDIFLLLTVGLTRTELDQSRNSGVGSSVALEALGTLSGAESAVTDTVPVDEFRFGSTFSSRSGRTEPTVTIGKRLSERIRASVTTTLSETSEVRSNVEYRATERVSIEGSFDNGRNVASAGGGNLGGDVRWRIEFR